jgi:heat shock protein HtpX
MWEAIRANRRRSAVLITGMALVLFALGALGGNALAGPDGAIIGLGVALIIWGVQLAIYATNAEAVLLTGVFAKELKREDSPQLFNVVEEMKIAAGLPFMPRIHLIDDPAPNAFAVGNKPDHSAICVTTGLLHRLNRDELQGVIAHEIGHLKNRDVQFMTLAAVMLGSIVILSDVVLRTMRFGGRSRSRDDERGGGGQLQLILFVVAILFAILGPVMAQLLYFACSRKREYLADASGAQFTRYPEGLASALEKISQAQIAPTFANKATAPLFIINPFSGTGVPPVQSQATNGRDARSTFSLFSTHPPTAERIRILRGMTGAALADYEAAYRQAKGTGLIGTQTLSADQPQPVRAASADEPIKTRQQARDLSYRAHGYLTVHCNCGLDISIPEGYEQDTIRCIRCGRVLPIPAASVAVQSQTANPEPRTMQYTRTGTGSPRSERGWESFRCECGRTVQLSPSFNAPHIRCTGCGRDIQIS